MKVKIQWKLMASYLMLVLLIGAILYGYLSHTLESNLLSEVRESIRLQPLKSTEEAMVDTANILAAGLEDRLRETRPDVMDLRAAMDRALRRNSTRACTNWRSGR